MTKTLLIAASLIIITAKADAQTKIKDGTVIGSSSLPNTNAVLELESTRRGLLMPRIALQGTSFAAPLSAHVAGMVVYNTATVSDVTPGYYYNDGSSWKKMAYVSPSLGGGGNDLTNSNGIIVTGGTGATLKSTSLRLDSTAVAKMLNQSPVKDSLSTVITNQITGGSISGQDLSNSNGIIVTGGTGATLKFTSLRLDSTAVAKMLNQSPVKDSLSTVITNQITGGSISGENLSNGNGIIVNGGTGTTLKATNLRLDSTAIAKFMGESPVKDSTIKVMTTGAGRDSIIKSVTSSTIFKDSISSIINAGSITGQNLTNSNGIIVNGGTGTTLKATSLRLDSTAVAKMIGQSPVKDSLNSKYWTTGGNFGTNPSTHSIGTLDNVSVAFRTNNIQRMILDSTGKLGIAKFPDNFSAHQLQLNSAKFGTHIDGLNQHHSLAQGPSASTGASSENPFTLIGGNSFLTRSEVVIGGSTNMTSEAAAQYIRFYTHPTKNTALGTERMTISPNGNVGIGTSSPDASAALDISSTTQGVKFPTMTWAQVQAIVSPASGVRLYCSSFNSFLTNQGTPATPIWRAEVTADIDTGTGKVPVGTYRTALGNKTAGVSLTMDNLTLLNVWDGTNNIPNVRTTSGTKTLRLWNRSNWSGAAGTIFATSATTVFTPSPNDGGMSTRNNYSITATTTPTTLHPGLSAAIQSMIPNETNTFTILNLTDGNMYRVEFFNFNDAGTDKVLIGMYKLR